MLSGVLRSKTSIFINTDKTPNMKKKTYTKPEVNKIGKGSNLMVQFFTKKDKGNGKV